MGLSFILKMQLFCNLAMKFTEFTLTIEQLNLLRNQKKLNAKENDEIIVELTGIVSTKSDDKIFWDKKFKINEILSVSLKKDKQKTLILGKK